MQSAAFEATVAAAMTLDVGAFKTVFPYPPRQWYRTPAGSLTGFDTYLLAGLHTLRAGRPELFPAESVAASRDWLTANGWPIPALDKRITP